METKETPDLPPVIATSRPSSFTAVTTVGKRVCDNLAGMVKSNPNADLVVQEIKKHVPELLQEVLTVAFEKAKLWPIIERDPDLAHFTKLKFEEFLDPGDFNSSELNRAKVVQSLLITILTLKLD